MLVVSIWREVDYHRARVKILVQLQVLVLLPYEAFGLAVQHIPFLLVVHFHFHFADKFLRLFFVGLVLVYLFLESFNNTFLRGAYYLRFDLHLLVIFLNCHRVRGWCSIVNGRFLCILF